MDRYLIPAGFEMQKAQQPGGLRSQHIDYIDVFVIGAIKNILYNQHVT